jgi:hypothetical protein
MLFPDYLFDSTGARPVKKFHEIILFDCVALSLHEPQVRVEKIFYVLLLKFLIQHDGRSGYLKCFHFRTPNALHGTTVKGR